MLENLKLFVKKSNQSIKDGLLEKKLEWTFKNITAILEKKNQKEYNIFVHIIFFQDDYEKLDMSLVHDLR